MPKSSLSLVALILFSAMVATANAAEVKAVTIGLIGDSTVATTYGWGPGFSKKVTSDTKVLNFAKNGATLDSLSNKLDELLKQKPDYVLVQFGHNDQKRYGTKEYGEKLKSYVDRIKAAGGKPVIVSSVTRRNFGPDGKIQPRPAGDVLKEPLYDYAKKAGEVAKQEGVPFLDLYTISVAHHNKIGPAETATYDFNETDKTHFSPKGTDATAELVVTELKVVVPELAGHLQ
ncbi:rhamnogalacturonan acetylesterase [Blastopirellula sp. JC732]|uniref:Rhamnogalacturonan acetylesterase n=1 Tax=Blastopirellula sediminis TaxID=2894196 RepID=A0A9X1SFU7_9BACT|nr:rhamnogalacturonan acetylesterase [Blastopirellula sediminis]MCC9608500.1 rhamnogalacturonan acetylesterase [Blastopirellula sediminis]MCC9628723.1 rhamnogalacturonan acetylesterase [Blastopirellula sediminis]